MPKYSCKKIEKFQAQLNSLETIPSGGFRRNTIGYPLICYLNNITACYLSNNSKPIVTFIGRARKHMKRYPANDNWVSFYKLADEYVNLVEKHLQEHGIDTTYKFNSR